jgi:ParB family chromosome partitioning protein
MSEDKKRGLGRGLSALLGDDAEEMIENRKVVQTGGIKTLPIEQIKPGRFQPRHGFDEEKINDLVESIREKGVLQPILVRSLAGHADVYEIVAGERRWRAAQLAQLHEMPVIIKELDDRAALEIALVENLQRQDLSAIEEADGYRRLMEEFSHTQEDLGRVIGKSRSHVANTLRLLNLPRSVKDLMEAGSLSAGHGRALLAANDPAALAEMVVSKGFNVRQTEKLVQDEKAVKIEKAVKKQAKEKDPDTLALERDLSNSLGLKVSIDIKGRKGAVTIHYESLEQLDDILHRLSGKPSGAGIVSAMDEDLNLHIDLETSISETDLLADIRPDIGPIREAHISPAA